MQSKKDNNLSNLRQRVLNKSQSSKIGLDGSIYQLARELGCVGDILGREFEVIYEGDKIKKIIQKPIKMVHFVTLMKEAKLDSERQEKHMKEQQRKNKFKGGFGKR